MRAPAGLAALLVAAGAAAQTVPLPQKFVRDEGLQAFRQCRAAVFYHLDGPEDPDSAVPRSLARALLDQIDFIMAETIFGKPRGDLDEQAELLRYTENWFLAFTRTINQERARLSDAATRDRVLTRCVPVIWAVARIYVDGLAAWRSAADQAPPVMSQEAAREARKEIERRLGLRE